MLLRLSEYMIPVRALSKPHKGVVVDNEDPKKLGRVKCTVSGILEAGKDDLPWISTTTDPSKLDVPEVGDCLKIIFPFNDIYAPEYDGYYSSEANINADFDTNYPKTFGLSKGGLKIVHNKETGQSDIVHPNGSTLVAKEDGTLELVIGDKLVLTIGGDYEITADGDIKFTTTGEFKVTADGGLDLSTDGEGKFVGKGGTTVGDSGGITKVEGATVLLAGGGLPVALLSSQTIGPGNLGAPVMGVVVDGSSKVLAPK